MSGSWLCIAGLLTGWHAASWGAFKDSPYEGFRWTSYLRSIVIGVAAAVGFTLTGRATHIAPVLLIGLLYSAERLTTEWWKTFVREDDQTAYSIPMRLGFKGRPVDSPVVRYAAGLSVLLGLVAAVTSLSIAHPTVPGARWGLPLVVAGFGGWLTACGGAWKDAPVEGFSGYKFLRSPAVATAWAAPLSLMGHDLVVLTLSAGGFAVASIETYKTFLTGGRPPGKFATKAVRFAYPTRRAVFAVVHVALWGVLAVTLAAQLDLRLGLSGWPDRTGVSASLLLAVLVTSASAGMSALVLRSMIRILTSGS
jgi:hypothetical protein